MYQVTQYVCAHACNRRSFSTVVSTRWLSLKGCTCCTTRTITQGLPSTGTTRSLSTRIWTSALRESENVTSVSQGTRRKRCTFVAMSLIVRMACLFRRASRVLTWLLKGHPFVQTRPTLHIVASSTFLNHANTHLSHNRPPSDTTCSAVRHHQHISTI